MPTLPAAPKASAAGSPPTRPGNYGWPYCYSPSLPYIDFDFVTRTSGQPFNCAAPVNNSPRNTGRSVLPRVAQPDFWYTYEARTPCAGRVPADPADRVRLQVAGHRHRRRRPARRPDLQLRPRLTSETKFPEYYDNAVVFGEFTRDKLFMMRTDGAATSRRRAVPARPHLRQPDGHGVRPRRHPLPAGVRRRLLPRQPRRATVRDPVRQRHPLADRHPRRHPDRRARHRSPCSSPAPARYDPDPGESISFAWDFTSDGTVDSADPNPSFTYTANGVYTAKLTVTDSSGKTAVLTRTITVGNTAPDGHRRRRRSRRVLQLGRPGAVHGHRHRPGGRAGRLRPRHRQLRPRPRQPRPRRALHHRLHRGAADPGRRRRPRRRLPVRRDQRHLHRPRRERPAGADHGRPGDHPDAPPAGRARPGQAGRRWPTTGDTGGGQHITGIDPGDHIAFDPISLGGIGTVTLRHSGGSAATAGTARATVDCGSTRRPARSWRPRR